MRCDAARKFALTSSFRQAPEKTLKKEKLTQIRAKLERLARVGRKVYRGRQARRDLAAAMACHKSNVSGCHAFAARVQEENTYNVTAKAWHPLRHYFCDKL